MTNAKHELLNHIEKREVEYVKIIFGKNYQGTPIEIQGTLEQVLPLLNFEYDSGFGTQELEGYIWYTDGTWSERGEYDGYEWWEYKVRPSKDIKLGAW